MNTTDLGRVDAMRLMSPKDVASTVPGLSVSILAQLRFRGEGPKYMKPSAKVVVYVWRDVATWLESTKRAGTAEAVQ